MLPSMLLILCVRMISTTFSDVEINNKKDISHSHSCFFFFFFW